MIKKLAHDEIDKKKWDNCIRHAFNGNAYACSWYLDIVHPEWEALVEDDYVRVMPLTGNKKWGINYLFTPYFTQQLGLFSTSLLTPEVLNRFLMETTKHYRFAEYNLNVHNRTKDARFTLIPNTNHLLDLINDYPKAAKRYSTNTKRNLKKAKSNGLTVSKSAKPEEIVTLFRNNRGKDIRHWKNFHYLRLQHLMYMAIHKGRGVVYGVYTPENRLCAGAFFLKGNNHLIFLFSGADETARELHAMTFLIDWVIKEFSGTQFIFDFEGSNNPNLARFYRGFGGREVIYYRYYFNNLPFPLRQLKAIGRKG